VHRNVWSVVFSVQGIVSLCVNAIEKFMAASSGRVDFFVGALHCIQLTIVHDITE
jgi:hypothetical protein